MPIIILIISMLLGVFGLVMRWKYHENWFLSRKEKYFSNQFTLFMNKVYTSIAFGLVVAIASYIFLLILAVVITGKGIENFALEFLID